MNHVAEAAGLAENSRAELVAAVEDACHEALKQVSKDEHRVVLTVEALPGKVEAVLEFKPSSDAAASFAAKSNASGQKSESVRREIAGDRARIILSKTLPR